MHFEIDKIKNNTFKDTCPDVRINKNKTKSSIIHIFLVLVSYFSNPRGKTINILYYLRLNNETTK